MKARTFSDRHLREGSKSLGRNGLDDIRICKCCYRDALACRRIFMLMMNLNHIAKLIENDVEIRVHVDALLATAR